MWKIVYSCMKDVTEKFAARSYEYLKLFLGLMVVVCCFLGTWVVSVFSFLSERWWSLTQWLLGLDITAVGKILRSGQCSGLQRTDSSLMVQRGEMSIFYTSHAEVQKICTVIILPIDSLKVLFNLVKKFVSY